MPSKDSITKTIRLNAEDAAIVEELMEREGLSWSGAIHQLIGCTPIDSNEGVPLEKDVPHHEGCTPVPQMKNPVNEFTWAEIETMCGLNGYDIDEYMSALCEAMNDGTLEYVNGELRGTPQVDLSKLEEACHEKNVDIEKAIEKCTQMIYRSGL